jgi:hypothetical protein
MAEIFPDEGIDVIMAIFPKNGTNLSSLFLGLFTSQTGTTVPAANAVLSTSTGVTEAAYTSYARISIAAASWGAQAAGSPDGRKTTAGQVTMPTVTGAAGTAVNGYFIADSLTTGKAICYANFTEGAWTPAVNDVFKVTPTMNFGA